MKEKIHFMGQAYVFYIGFLEGMPAFLGYALGVFFTFSIWTKEREISVPANTNFSTFTTFPPSMDTAF